MSSSRICRRAFSRATVLAAAALAGALLRGRGAKAENEHLSIAVTGGRSALSALPLTVAEQLGYFRAEGLEVAVVERADGGRALHEGADILCGPFEQVIRLRGQGQPAQAFVLQGRTPQVAMGVSTRTLPTYRDVSDLRGCKIGVAWPGSSPTTVAKLVLARGGLKPSEVSFVGVGPMSDALWAFRTGRLDAISHIDPLITQLEQRGELRIIGDTRTLKGTQEVFGGPMPASCLYAPQGFIQKNAQACQSVANGIVRALKWLQTASPSDIVKTVPPAYLQGDHALYLTAFSKVREAISPDGLISEEGARTALRVMAGVDAALQLDRIDVSHCYTNEFARRAKEKFHA